MNTILIKPWKGVSDKYVDGFCAQVLEPSGIILIMGTANGEPVKERYMGYTKSEAIKLFKEKYYKK